MTGDSLGEIAYAIPYSRGEDHVSGRVFIVDGPANESNEYALPSAWLEGSKREAWMGYGLAPAGDSDGDGLADLLVGETRFGESTGLEPGRAYVFLGPIGPGWTVEDANLTLIGESEQDRAGENVASGDFNGDEHPDVLVGAYWSSPRGEYSGRAWLVYGPRSGTLELAEANAVMLGEDDGDYAGKSVANAGDVDGDGDDELLVGALLHDDDGERAGRGFLLYGPVSGEIGLEASDVAFTSLGALDWTGWSLGAAGDVNRDGMGDIFVTAPQQQHYGTSRVARVSLFLAPFGSVEPPAAADRVWTGDGWEDSFGTSAVLGTDLSGDGLPDLAVGAPYESREGTWSGRVYLGPL